MTERRRSSATRAKVSRSGPPVCRSGLSFCLLLVFFLARGREIADVFWEVFFSLFFDCAGFPVSALGAVCWSLCIFSLYLYGAERVCPCWPLCFFLYSGPKNRRDPLRSLPFRYICLLLTGSRAISILYWKCAGFVFPHPVPRVLFLWELKCFPEIEALGLGACRRRKRNSRGHVQ